MKHLILIRRIYPLPLNDLDHVVIKRIRLRILWRLRRKKHHAYVYLERFLIRPI